MKYHEDFGAITKMAETGAGAYSFATVNLQRALHTYSATTVVSPLLAIGASVLYYGIGKYKRRTQKDVKILGTLWNEIISLGQFIGFFPDSQSTKWHGGKFDKQLAKEQWAGDVLPKVEDSLRFAGGLMAKMVQSIPGKERLSDEAINKIIWGGKMRRDAKKKGNKRLLTKEVQTQAELDFENNMKRLNYLMTELKRTMKIISFRLAALVVSQVIRDGWDDDEEDEETLGWIDGAYYSFENFATTHADDANLFNDPLALSQNMTTSAAGRQLGTFIYMMGIQDSPSDTYLAGENKGQNKYLTVTAKIINPKLFTDHYLGFRTKGEKDYKPLDKLSRKLRTEKKDWEVARDLYKIEKIKELEATVRKNDKEGELTKSEVASAVETRFKALEVPTLKEAHFDNKGNMLPQYRVRYAIWEENFAEQIKRRGGTDLRDKIFKWSEKLDIKTKVEAAKNKIK